MDWTGGRVSGEGRIRYGMSKGASEGRVARYEFV